MTGRWVEPPTFFTKISVTFTFFHSLFDLFIRSTSSFIFHLYFRGRDIGKYWILSLWSVIMGSKILSFLHLDYFPKRKISLWLENSQSPPIEMIFLLHAIKKIKCLFVVFYLNFFYLWMNTFKLFFYNEYSSAPSHLTFLSPTLLYSLNSSQKMISDFRTSMSKPKSFFYDFP